MNSVLGCGSTGAVKKMGEPGELTEANLPKTGLKNPKKYQKTKKT